MFEFGKNWNSFSTLISEERILLAQAGLRRLFPNDEIAGKLFFDIGCGSGLSMLAALRLGASEVRGIDIDADSVSTTRTVLDHFAQGSKYSVERKSVFDLAPKTDGTYPVVHSWGVLHHTGDMWSAIRKASSIVAPGGIFALALYRSTPCCPAWKVEKRIYSSCPKAVQSIISSGYKAAFFAGKIATGHNPIAYVAQYNTRGMSWSHDIHDWLGGYPYESAKPDEVVSFLENDGWKTQQIGSDRKTLGVFGSYCNEYVARRSI
jgi:predicted RNA methylase